MGTLAGGWKVEGEGSQCLLWLGLPGGPTPQNRPSVDRSSVNQVAFALVLWELPPLIFASAAQRW